MLDGEVPHRRIRHTQKLSDYQAKNALVADDQQMTKFPVLREGGGEAGDAFGERLKAFTVSGRRMLPVGAPRGVVFRIFML